MKTKIVYILSSTENDYYLEQTMISLYSLKMHNPESHVILIVDERTEKSITGTRKNIMQYVDEIKVIKVPTKFNQIQTSRYLKTSLYSYIDDDYLFIDGDTIICDNISDIDNIKNPISAVLDIHMPLSNHQRKKSIIKWANKIGWEIKNDEYYNSGVMKVNKSQIAQILYENWHHEWLINSDKGFPRDQPSLGKVNEELGGIISPLADIWNCQIIDNGLCFILNANIIHYFSSAHNKTNACPYLFGNLKIYEAIRKDGMSLSSDLTEMILNAKSQFLRQTCIISDKDIFFYESPLVVNLKKLYMNHLKFYNVIQSILSFLKHPIEFIKRN